MDEDDEAKIIACTKEETKQILLSDQDFKRERIAFLRSQREKPAKKARKKKSNVADDVEGFLGPWAGFEDEQESSAPSLEELARYTREKSRTTPATFADPIAVGRERSMFHGKVERDHRGKTFISVPDNVGMSLSKPLGSFECKIPKTLSHSWAGHTKAVSRIEFFPHTGHLLLSGSGDQRIKIWSIYGDQECLRTYYGHNKPIIDINSSPNGRRFVSSSYDRTFKIWITESGKCIFAKENDDVLFTTKFVPNEPNLLMTGGSGGIINCWDLRSGQVAQEYKVGNSVNSLEFLGSDLFIVSSDDKKMSLWKMGEAGKCMESTQTSDLVLNSLQIDKNEVAYQFLNNEIRTYRLGVDMSLQLTDKSFAGHVTGGNPCRMTISPNMKLLCSGDGNGDIFVWDWDTCKKIKSFKAHEQACLDICWNPQHPQSFASAGQDEIIKLWE